jgi:hypothetical protein
MIERNNGRIDGDQVTIRVQRPEPVRLEQNPPGRFPVKLEEFAATGNTIPSGKKGLSVREFKQYRFEGNGLVIRGRVTGDKDVPADYVAGVDFWLDGKKVRNMKLPRDFIKRSTEVFWIFELPDTGHTLEINWLNPIDGADILLESAITWSGKSQIN